MSADSPIPTDEQLVDALRTGDQTAATALIERYWPAIHRYASGYLNDENLAEDVAQETFARLSDGAELPTGAFKPWIYRVARNRCLDILRRYQRSPTHHVRIRTGFDAGGASAGPRTRAANEERRHLIRQIIETMPDEYRDVLMLKFFEGFSRSEMAESLGVSEATIKGRLVRASTYLQEELRKLTGPAE